MVKVMATPEIKPDATLAGKIDLFTKKIILIRKLKSKVHNVACLVYFLT